MKTAMQNSKIHKILLTVYVLVVLGFSAAARASDYSVNPIRDSYGRQMKTTVGQVAVDLEGRSFLVVSDNVVYELRGHDELSSFNGMRVEVKAYELMYKVGPVFELAAYNPLMDDVEEKTAPAPVLVVVEIREVVE